MRVPELKLFVINMKDMTYLQDLSLQHNFIDEEMTKWLVIGLISNYSIMNLDLSNNQINDNG